jgi:hypothetical protein
MKLTLQKWVNLEIVIRVINELRVADNGRC